MDVIIFANSPGEVAGWARPTVDRLRTRGIGERIFLFIPPCPFASGREAEVARMFPGVAGVVSPREYGRYILFGRLPHGFFPSGKGVVVHLGGDPLHSVLVARKLSYPAILYTDRSAALVKRFEVLLVEDTRIRDKVIRKGASPEKVRIVGNLAVDGVRPELSREEAFRLFRLEDNKLTVGLFPGSREQEIRLVAPFFLRCAEIIAKVDSEVQFVLGLSPFASLEALEAAIRSKPDYKFFDGATGRLAKDGEATEIITDAGLRVRVEPEKRYDVMQVSDLAIVMPGTVTGELGFLGVPMLVTVALNRPEEVPLPGLVGQVGAMPFVGPLFKRFVVPKMVEKVEFIAIPNKRARQKIVPELRGILRPEDVAIASFEVLRDKKRRARISSDLKAAMGERGASDGIVDAIVEVAGRWRK